MKLKTAFILAGAVAVTAFAVSKLKEWKEQRDEDDLYGDDFVDARKLRSLWYGPGLDTPDDHLAYISDRVGRAVAPAVETPEPPTLH